MLTSTAITNALAAENRDFTYTAIITLKSGTTLTISNNRIWSGGFEYEDAISEESDFQLGAAIINKFTLTINNNDRAYSNYNFTMATVVIRVGVTAGYVQRGKYYVNEATYDDTLITLECYDYMMRFDQPYSLSTTNYTGGVTLATIIRDACSDCDVTQYTTSFTNSSLIVTKKPDGESTTFRDVISWIAQIAGCYARCDVRGRLVLSRLPASSSAGHTVTGIFSHSVSVKPITFTGVSIVVSDDDGGTVSTYTYGTDGYVINIADNPFITPSNVATIGSSLWTYAQLLNGTFYKGTVSHLCNPLIEAGDKIRFTDRNGNAYDVFVSKTTFTSNEQQTTVSSARDPARSYSGAMSPATKTLIEAQQLVFNEKTLREQLYGELEEAINSKNGLYMTTEAGASGGNVYYLHDQPLLADSHLVWKMTSDAFAVTDDYNGENPSATEWDAGLTVDGTLIANIMDTIGIDFDWGVGGSLVIKDTNNNETFYANADTGVVRINAASLSISGSTVQNIASDVATEKATEIANSANNLLMTPFDLTSEYWVVNGSITGSQTDPYGGTEAVRVTKTSSSGTETNLSSNTLNNNPIKSTGQNYKFSVWLKGSSAGTIFIALNNNLGRKEITLTTSWKRYTIETYVSEITDSNQVTIGAWGSWSISSVYIYNPVVEYADPYMDQETTFNQLTNNGQVEGITLTNGQMYINASYIHSGTLSLGGTNNENGLINVYDNSGNIVGIWDKNGIVSKSFNSNGSYIGTYISDADIVGRYHSSTSDATGTQIMNITTAYTSSNKYVEIDAYKNCNLNLRASTSENVSYGISIIPTATNGYPIVMSPTDISGNLSCDGLNVDGNVEIAGTTKSGNPFMVYNTQLGKYTGILKNNIGSGILINNDIAVIPLYQGFLDTTGEIYLGNSTYKFACLWANNGTIQTSDKNDKKEIEPFDERHEKAFMELQPITYKWKAEGHDRRHFGFIAQDAEKAFNNNGITAEDAAFICCDEQEDGTKKYSLRYSEMVALNTHMIQTLVAENKELKTQLADLKGRLAKLEKLISK